MKIKVLEDYLNIDDNGISIRVDLKKYELTQEQRTALKELIASGNQQANQVQTDQLKGLKAYIGAGDANPSGFMRFDFKFVTID